jgi:hypothetical protein
MKTSQNIFLFFSLKENTINEGVSQRKKLMTFLKNFSKNSKKFIRNLRVLCGEKKLPILPKKSRSPAKATA